jgi:hypothetical protein
MYLSVCCQVRVGVCGYVLSCHVFNTIVSQGPDSDITCPVLVTPRRGFYGRACTEPGYADDVQWAVRW